MNLKSLSLLIALVWSAGTSFGQQVRYKVLTDDPSDYKAFSLSLEPFYGDLHPINLTLGWSVRADALILNRIELRADFRRSYFDMHSGEADEGTEYLAKNGVKNQLFAEAGGSIFLTNKTKRKSLKVVLSSYRSGNYQVTRSIQVPGTVRTMWGLRGGMNYMTTPVEIEDDHLEYMTVQDENNTDAGSGQILTMFRRSTIFAGLHWKSIKNLKISSDYGVKSHKGATDFYLDVLFAPILGLADVVNSTSGTLYNINFEGDNVKRIGWRMGWIMRSPNTTFLSYKVELGSRPGYRSKKGINFENAFMMFTVGLNIPMRIKHIDKTNE